MSEEDDKTVANIEAAIAESGGMRGSDDSPDPDPASDNADAPTSEPTSEESEPSPTPEGEAPEAQGSETQAAQGETAAPSEPAVAPPFGMSQEDAQVFAKLPPELQRWNAQREQQRNQWIQQKSYEFAHKEREIQQERERYQGYEKVFTPEERQSFQIRGVPEEQVLSQLMNGQRHLDNPQTRHAALRYICDSYGVDPIELTNMPQQVDPQAVGLQSELQNLKAELEQLKSGAQHQQVSTLEQEAAAFAQEKNPDGSPAHPHFPHLVGDMAPRVQQLQMQYPNAHPREILRHVYQEVTASHPLVQAQQKLQQMQQAEAARAAKEKERAQKARIAGKPVGSSGGRAAPGRPADETQRIEGYVSQFIS
jgi:hypothetical protein